MNDILETQANQKGQRATTINKKITLYTASSVSIYISFFVKLNFALRSLRLRETKPKSCSFAPFAFSPKATSVLIDKVDAQVYSKASTSFIGRAFGCHHFS